MSNLLIKINEDIKQAMRDKKPDILSVLRMVITAVRNKEITIRQAGVAEVTNEIVVEAIRSEIKKRKDSIESYIQGGRQELADKEKFEEEILAKYLPEQLSDEELERIIKEIVSAQSAAPTAKDFGKLMGEAIKGAKGKADGARVSAILKKILAE
jgi:uncharacterized protein YqeY